MFPNGKLIELEEVDHSLEIDGNRLYSIKLFGDWFEKDSTF